MDAHRASYYNVIMSTTKLDEPLLDPKATAAFLAVPPNTLTRWRLQESGPRFYRVGKHVRYRRDDVETWLEGRANARKGSSGP